jgi:hypothetical protein
MKGSQKTTPDKNRNIESKTLAKSFFEIKQISSLKLPSRYFILNDTGNILDEFFLHLDKPAFSFRRKDLNAENPNGISE